jgi:fluoroacetyl-CoA thioesterase
MSAPPVGSSTESLHIVTEADTALALGNPNVNVLGSPRLLQWIEQTIDHLWDGCRDPATEVLLGTEFHFKHLGAAPVGSALTIRATVLETSRRRGKHQVEAFTAEGPVCEGWSENALMRLETFRERLARDVKGWH